MEEKLIVLVCDHQEIYDTNHPNYMKSKFKQNIWKQIAKELNLKDADQAKSAWARLRNNHRDALRRQKRMTRSGTTKIKPWKFQSQMEFLLQYMANEIRKTNITFDDEEVSQDFDPLHVDDVIVDESDEMAKPDPIEGDFLESFSTSSQRKRLRKGNIDTEKNIEQREQMSKERMESRTKLEEATVPKDDLYLFFMSMFEQTKKMPHASQHAVRRNVFLTVSDEEARLLNISNSSCQQLGPTNNHICKLCGKVDDI